jgi:hypothetical protein
MGARILPKDIFDRLNSDSTSMKSGLSRVMNGVVASSLAAAAAMRCLPGRTRRYQCLEGASRSECQLSHPTKRCEGTMQGLKMRVREDAQGVLLTSEAFLQWIACILEVNAARGVQQTFVGRPEIGRLNNIAASPVGDCVVPVLFCSVNVTSDGAQ